MTLPACETGLVMKCVVRGGGGGGEKALPALVVVAVAPAWVARALGAASRA